MKTAAGIVFLMLARSLARMATQAALTTGPVRLPADFGEMIQAATKELAEIRSANRVTDAEIRRLRDTTRRRLERIWENLRHVEDSR